MIEMHEPAVADWNAKRKKAREIAASHGHRLGRFSPIFYPGSDSSAFAATQAACEGCGQSVVIRAYWRVSLGQFLLYFRLVGGVLSGKCARRTQANRAEEERTA